MLRGLVRSVCIHSSAELALIIQLKLKLMNEIDGNFTFNFITGIDLKVAAKLFGTKFACGSSVTGEDEIVIQGDVKDDLFDFIPEKWPEIDEDLIDDLGDQKR